MTTEVMSQQRYYARTAEQYDEMHVKTTDEHARALAAFIGLAEISGPVRSVLDVGAGTGRGMRKMMERWSQADIVGIEPVQALREIGHKAGLPVDQLRDGNALELPFGNDTFDYVTETGVLHHIRQPKQAVREMVRVARKGIMISDNNHIGGGSRIARHMKFAMKTLGVMKPMIWLQTRGRMYRSSEGDGIFYTFTAFDCVFEINKKFPFLQVMNTRPCSGFNPYRFASHVMLFASKEIM